MKFLAVLMGLVSWLSIAGTAAAESWSKRLTPEKTSDEMYTFTITVEPLKESDVGELLQFVVTVKGMDLIELPHRSAELRVLHGTEFVSSCVVQPTGQAGERMFSFRVAEKYTEKSTFRYAQTGDFGHISYWFYLEDFVKSGKLSKTSGVSRRAKPATIQQVKTSHFEKGIIRPTGLLAAVPQKEASYGECAQDGVDRVDPIITCAALVAAADRA